MLKVFFDETTDNVDDFFLAGWLAASEEWEHFSAAWDKELKAPPSIAYFNHNDALGKKCEFEGWSDGVRDAKMRSLAGVISRYNLTGLVGHINIPKLNSLFAHSAMSRRQLRAIIRFTEPYHHAGQCVVSMTLGYQIVMAKNPATTVDFIFDQGVRYLDDIIENYPRLLSCLPEQARKIAGTIMPGDDRKISPLQASDFLAGQELLKLRTKTVPPPLQTMDNGRVHRFSCDSLAGESIRSSVSKLNVLWATKQLITIQDKKKRKSEWEEKTKKKK